MVQEASKYVKTKLNRSEGLLDTVSEAGPLLFQRTL